jgi:hypothetical protein
MDRNVSKTTARATDMKLFYACFVALTTYKAVVLEKETIPNLQSIN